MAPERVRGLLGNWQFYRDGGIKLIVGGYGGQNETA